MQHFLWGHTLLVISIIGSYLYGGLGLLTTVVLLVAIEISMSFDNAVINVRILKRLNVIWQKIFLTWGIIIAVFGMRFLFPIVIVSIAGGMTMLESFNTAISNPQLYKEILDTNQEVIFALGGAFLLMIFINWLFEEKTHHWIKPLEYNTLMRICSKLPTLPLVIAIFIGLLISLETQDLRIAIYYFSGILLYETVQIIDDILSPEDENGNIIVKSGIAGFLYLELLDASFSFDGVIGAFAITNNIFIIMLGLGIGALYVREMTIYFLHKGTIDTFRYLEHGAHYAIGILAFMMFTKIFIHLDELIVGSIGIIIILISLIHSHFENLKDFNNEEKII
jgi:uncharacterized protein